MSLQSGSLQTPVTDFNVPGILDAQVTAMDVLDPTENDERIGLLEVDDEFDVVLTWQLTGAATPVVVAPPTPQVGLYKLTATINHSPTGNPAELSEMFGFAESTPVDITSAVVETS